MRKKGPADENLISAYIEVETRGGRSLAEALRQLNSATGMNLYHGRIRQYERGRFVPHSDVIFYMLEIVLRDRLTSAGLEPAVIEKILKACKLPEKST